MTYLNKITQRTRGINTTYLKYVNNKQKYNQYLHCFFEGDDDKYYYENRINSFSSLPIIDYDCGGKENVIKIYEKINGNNNYIEGNLYFVDRDFDFDSNINENNIYNTPFHSIENFYTLDCVFESILHKEFKIDRYSLDSNIQEDYKYIVDLYRNKKNEFMENVKLLNAWYCIQTLNGKNLSEEIRPDLSKLKKWKDIEDGYSIEELMCKTKNYILLDNTNVQQEIQKNGLSMEGNIRGKYLEQFFVDFITTLIEEINKKNIPLKGKYKKIKINISSTTYMSYFTQYAYTPECLKKYLKENTLENLSVA